MDKWFRIAFRYAIEKYPCLRCSFVLASHGRSDAVFGVGKPLLCLDCAKEDWEDLELCPQSHYDKNTQLVLAELGDEWYLPQIP